MSSSSSISLLWPVFIHPQQDINRCYWTSLAVIWQHLPFVCIIYIHEITIISAVQRRDFIHLIFLTQYPFIEACSSVATAWKRQSRRSDCLNMLNYWSSMRIQTTVNEMRLKIYFYLQTLNKLCTSIPSQHIYNRSTTNAFTWYVIIDCLLSLWIVWVPLRYSCCFPEFLLLLEE